MILIENRRKQKTENILSFILGIEPTNSVTSVAALTIELQELLVVYVAKLKFSAVLCPLMSFLARVRSKSFYLSCKPQSLANLLFFFSLQSHLFVKCSFTLRPHPWWPSARYD